MASSGDATVSPACSMTASESSSSGSKITNPKVRLQAKNGDVFVIDLAVAKLSKVIERMIDDLSGDRGDVDLASAEPIPLLNVSAPILHKILTWMEYHYKNDSHQPAEPDVKFSYLEDKISEWDKWLISDNQGTWFEILVASNYLNIIKLSDVLCRTIADSLKNLTMEQIREKYNIPDFTPEEEETIRLEEEEFIRMDRMEAIRREKAIREEAIRAEATRKEAMWKFPYTIR